MKNVMRLRARGLLTEQQVLSAGRFARNPNAFSMAPTLFRFLHDVIVKELDLEKIETMRGLPARSAKAILSLLLFAIEEVDGFAWIEGGDATSKEMVEYLKGENKSELMGVMRETGMTQIEAQIYLILLHERGRVLSKETLARRLYGGRALGDIPELKTVDVHICRVRKKMPKGVVITTVWGIGYMCEVSAIEERNEIWCDRVDGGETIRAIAREFGCEPSTVMRGVEAARKRKAVAA